MGLEGELTCEFCFVKGTWDSGAGVNGNLYQCEGCESIICTSCLEEVHGKSIGEIDILYCDACKR